MDNIEANAQPTQQPAANPAQSGYCIHVYVKPDGMSVATEPLSQELAEGENESTGTPVGGIKDALMKVMQIYQADGKDEESGEDDFKAGFGEAPKPVSSGNPLQGYQD